MVKEFFRGNWPLLAGGGIGLSISAYVLQRATGLPLLPDFSGVLSRSAAILSTIATATAWAGGLLLFGLLLYVFVVPLVNKIRDMEWERQQESATEQHQVAAPPSERPIIVQHSGSNLALRAAQTKASNLQTLLDSISNELSQLCYQVTGQQEPDAVRAIKVLGDSWREMLETMRGLDAQLSEGPRETPQEPTGGAPRGATWLTYESVLALVKAGNVGIKKAQGMVREHGGVVGRDDYQRLQKILSYLPSPIEERGTGSHEIQAVNRKLSVGEPANVTRKPQRAMPRTGTRKLPRGGKR